MATTARSYLTAGAALMSAGVIAVSPAAQPPSGVPSTDRDVRLAAAVTTTCQPVVGSSCGTGPSPAPTASSAASAAQSAMSSAWNIPANMLIDLANAPYNLLVALGAGNVQLGSQPDGGFSFQPTTQGVTLDQPAGSVVGLTADLNYAGNWWLYSPSNVLGTDLGDVPRYEALINVLLPFPALSVPLGNMVAAIAASQLPMDPGCGGTGPGTCDDPNAILSKSLNLQNVVDLFSPGGYTFPKEVDPITCSSTGQCDVTNPNGPQVPWSGQNVQLNPTTPWTAFYDSLTAAPDFSTIHPVTAQMVVSTLTNLGKAIFTSFNPFVPGTQCPLCTLFVPPTTGPIPGPVFPTATVVSTTTSTTTTVHTVATAAMQATAARTPRSVAVPAAAPATWSHDVSKAGPAHSDSVARGTDPGKPAHTGSDTGSPKAADGGKNAPRHQKVH